MEDEAWKAHLRIGYWRRNSVRRIGLQEIEDEASKAHWRTGDRGQSQVGAQEDRR